MEGYNTSGHVFKTDGEIILRTAEFDDAARISNYFTVNRDYLKPWEPKREEAFSLSLAGSNA